MTLSEQQKTRLVSVAQHMVNGGKVYVTDKHDNVLKESAITAVYSDYTVTLSDTVHIDYSIKQITIIPLEY